jgi:prepilin-type N-terminal cleavage/methylation domain-containing protein
MRKQLPSRLAFTLFEMLVSITLMGIFMAALSFHVVSMSNLWINRTDDDFFEQHVDGVVLFLSQVMEASETASPMDESGEQSQPVEWARPPGWSDMDDPLLYFRQDEAPALLVVEGEPLPAIQAYLHFDENEGLSILWYSALDGEDIEDISDLKRTLVSHLVTDFDYAYYEADDEEWEITEDPMEDDNDTFRLPDFIRLTFTHPDDGARLRSILIPHGSLEIPLF